MAHQPDLFDGLCEGVHDKSHGDVRRAVAEPQAGVRGLVGVFNHQGQDAKYTKPVLGIVVAPSGPCCAFSLSNQNCVDDAHLMHDQTTGVTKKSISTL